MVFFSGLVEENKAGRLLEDWERNALIGAYFGVTVEFDPALKLWKVKLRLEYTFVCGMLCGQGKIYDRWIFFDENGGISKVDEDCGCHAEWVS